MKVLVGWLLFCQWGLVMSAPLMILALTVHSGTDPTITSGEHPRFFWWRLVFPTSFLAGYLAFMVGCLLIGILRHPTIGTLRGWYHSLYAMRDAVLASLVFSGGYWGLLHISQGIAIFGLPADNLVDWLLRRVPIQCLALMIALILVESLRIIARDTLLPRDIGSLPFILLYLVFIVGSYPILQHNLAELSQFWTDNFLRYLAMAPFFIIVLVYFVLLILFRTEARADAVHLHKPIQVSLTMVGPSNVGKTMFFSRAYSLLSNTAFSGLLTLSPALASREYLAPKIWEIEEERQWPSPTVQVEELPLDLHYGLDHLFHFTWLDLPGGVFTRPEKEYEALTEQFNSHLINTDAVAMLIDATDLVQALDGTAIRYEEIYFAVARQLFTRLKTIGPGAHTVPLAIIVTKCCLVPPEYHDRFTHRLRALTAYWQLLAQQCGLPVPPIQIFLSSAIVTPVGGENIIPAHPQRLIAEQCMEPLIWLAVQVCRGQMGLLDFVNGFHGRSDIQEAIVSLESFVH